MKEFYRDTGLVSLGNWLVDRAIDSPDDEVRKIWNRRTRMCWAILDLSKDVPTSSAPTPPVLQDMAEHYEIPGSNDFYYLALNGEIGTYMSVDDYVRKIDAAKAIQVGIRSNGGSTQHALKLSNALTAAAARGVSVEATVHDFCFSAATTVLQGATVRRMGASAKLMIHQPCSFVAGQSRQLMEEAKMLETLVDRLVQIYSLRTGQSIETVRGWFTGKDRYFSATEARDANLIDEIFADETPGSLSPSCEPGVVDKSGRDL